MELAEILAYKRCTTGQLQLIGLFGPITVTWSEDRTFMELFFTREHKLYSALILNMVSRQLLLLVLVQCVLFVKETHQWVSKKQFIYHFFLTKFHMCQILGLHDFRFFASRPVGTK